MKILLIAFSVCVTVLAHAQQNDTTAIEDFSMYADAELANGAKRFCTSKVLDQSPNKLISLGYDYQGAHNMSLPALPPAASGDFRVRSVQGIRLSANVPIVSKTNILINLGASYADSRYQIENPQNHPLANNLQNRGLRTMGLAATVFKPLNEINFLFFQATADLNGDYSFSEFQTLSFLRYSGSAVYGWKKHDRLFYGFGVSRTYRVGEPNFFPVFMYNYTFPSRKWGIESVFPARGHVRRTFNPRTLAFFGYELEGQTYRLSGLKDVNGIVNPELRRSELRIRLMMERSVKNFVWVSVQAGLRYNWNLNLDGGDFFRGFTGDQPYILENSLTNALYFNVSINLVSP